MQSFDTTVDAPLEEIEPKVRAALQEQGFGVLTEIDVAATLRAKLGVERPALKILGACNPEFANRALGIDPSVSLVLPCNVVLETTERVPTWASSIRGHSWTIPGSTTSPARRRGGSGSVVESVATP